MPQFLNDDLELSESDSDSWIKDHAQCNQHFLKILRKLTAKLKDGHIYVTNITTTDWNLPVRWEWVENKLIITNTSNNINELNVGDEIVKINGINSKDYFKKVNEQIPLATVSGLNYRSQDFSL